jgi:hypothetical protein
VSWDEGRQAVSLRAAVTADDVACDPEQPRQRGVVLNPVSRTAAKRANEHFGGQIIGTVLADPPSQEAMDGTQMSVIDHREPRRVDQRLT